MAKHIMPEFHSAQKSFSAFTQIFPQPSRGIYPCQVRLMPGARYLPYMPSFRALKETACSVVVVFCHFKLMLLTSTPKSIGLGGNLFGVSCRLQYGCGR